MHTLLQLDAQVLLDSNANEDEDGCIKERTSMRLSKEALKNS